MRTIAAQCHICLWTSSRKQLIYLVEVESVEERWFFTFRFQQCRGLSMSSRTPSPIPGSHNPKQPDEGEHDGAVKVYAIAIVPTVRYAFLASRPEGRDCVI